MDSAEIHESSSDWERVKELVLAAQEEAPDDLEAWLAEHCSEPAIREEVLRLVAASAAAGDFLEGSASERHLGLPPPHPARIGRYRIIEEIGAGGLGVVYGAEDEELHRPVALKVLRTPEDSSGEMRKRLRWDARAACSLQHPNIVVVHDIGQQDDLDYIVMELVPGDTLKDAIPPEGMAPQRAVRIGLRILDGLEAAHAAKIVHRDLKPTNIMIGEDDAVKLLDFGLAKPPVPLPEGADSPQTIEGRFAGTAAYVSPEQAEGKDVDARGDIFAFGCVLFEMLAGRQAFEGPSAISVVARILGQDPPKLATLKPGIDPRLGDIVQRCLRKDPAERFQSVTELKQRLAECAAPLRTLLPRMDWRHAGWGIWAGMAGTVILLCVATWALTRRETVPEPAFYLTRMSSDGELTEDPAISADGKFIAFSSDRQSHGNLDIYVQNTRQGEATRVTFGPANAYQPRFSPDGGQLVFRSDIAGGGLYTLPTLGGDKKPRLLVAGGRDARFSPDGQWLAFWVGEEGYSLLGGSAQAMYIPASGGAAGLIAPGLEASASPVWDPTGQKLLCVGRAKGDVAPSWWLVDFHQRTATRTALGGTSSMGVALREPAGSRWLRPLAWLPDHTVLTAARQGDSNNIWGMRVSSEGRLLDPPRRWTGGTAYETHVSAAIDEHGAPTLVYDALTVTTSIRSQDLTADGAPTGESHRLVSGYSEVGPASLSADGSKLAFSAAEPVRQFIYLMDLNTKQTEEIGNQHILRSLGPLLSGNGQWLAYSLDNTGYLISSKGGVPEVVCRRCGYPTDAGMDASTMLFESGAVTNQFFFCTRNQTQQPVAHVADAPALVMNHGRWSQDHRWILFEGIENHQRAIYLAPVTSSGDVRRSQLVRISEGGYDAWEPVWSADGRRAYFIADLDGFRCIWGRRVDIQSGSAAGPLFPVAHFHRARESVSISLPNPVEFSLSAAPSFLVFTVAETNGEVWLRQLRPPGSR